VIANTKALQLEARLPAAFTPAPPPMADGCSSTAATSTSELPNKFAGPEMLEFLAMPERLICGVRRGCCPRHRATAPHVPEPEPLSLPLSRYFIDGREKRRDAAGADV
jgi:hypothetical protein